MWRGTALILEDSKIYAQGKVLRHPGSLAIVATPANKKAAIQYCRQNGYTHMPPVKNLSMEALEQRI